MTFTYTGAFDRRIFLRKGQNMDVNLISQNSGYENLKNNEKNKNVQKRNEHDNGKHLGWEKNGKAGKATGNEHTPEATYEKAETEPQAPITYAKPAKPQPQPQPAPQEKETPSKGMSVQISYSESYSVSTSTTIMYSTGSAGVKAADNAKTDNAEKTGNDHGKMTVGKMADHAMTIEKLKADAEARMERLRSIIEKILNRQYCKIKGIPVEQNDVDFLTGLKTDSGLTEALKGIRDGDLPVDPEVSAQAAEDISENGYWGVEQTSERMVQFAIAISGDDPQYADKLMDAVKEGYKQVADMFGGDDQMPEICKQTLSRTLEKMEAWKNGQSYDKPAVTNNDAQFVSVNYKESTSYVSSSTTVIID